VDVLAVDLDLRERPESEAYAAIRSVATHLGRDCRVFVKIDSTLRGPIAGLVEGALKGSGRAMAVVAPAFPEQGRCVIDGRLVVDGVPSRHVEEVVGSAPHVAVNAATPEQLREVAHAWLRHPEWLLVGSAGLARQIAPPPQPVPLDVRGDGSIVVVAGSPTRTTREQLEVLGAPDCVVILASPPTETRDAGEAAEALAAQAAEQKPRAIVLTGGATARAVIHRVGARHLRVLGELEPGVPVGILEDGQWHGLTVVTKAGGFGKPETLLDVVRALGPSSSST
jgi:D-threonate/D-erythronate kinase